MTHSERETKWTPRSRVWADGHKIMICDATTGHVVQCFAMCATSEQAEFIADKINDGSDSVAAAEAWSKRAS